MLAVGERGVIFMLCIHPKAVSCLGTVHTRARGPCCAWVEEYPPPICSVRG